MSASKPHSELPEHARGWIKIPPPPERLAEIREFANRDVLDMVEPEEMVWFLGLVEQVEALRREVSEHAAAVRHASDLQDAAEEQLEDLRGAARVVVEEFAADNPFVGYSIEALADVLGEPNPMRGAPNPASRPDK